jgi:hypothetical protein
VPSRAGGKGGDRDRPVIASADPSNMLTTHKIEAVLRGDDIVSRPSVFGQKSVPPNPVWHDAASCLAAPFFDSGGGPEASLVRRDLLWARDTKSSLVQKAEAMPDPVANPKGNKAGNARRHLSRRSIALVDSGLFEQSVNDRFVNSSSRCSR